ncbi:ABC transporter G family member 23 [Folsomia candida]|uniref:ABC transporter G family member 23 n=1 Tax=Folsomia candida TaxID=158441 RepID=UPI00160515B2|nr:ABC transporter G family member 23 [Folsomia candida]
MYLHSYGLLGASGCGKTTLLSCIVGSRQLDSGQVLVFGQPRPTNLGTLCGYMPQDTALLEVLNVSETLKYFGLLYGMSEIEIQNRIDFLIKFLEMQKVNRPISELSGGQRRRVSLAAAMIHNPRLLILDEPTVGLDPLLRHRIWEYLIDIAKNFGTSIAISTHYVEETKLCHKIGLMRGGRLLAEDHPKALLATHNCDKMTDLVLYLSQNDQLQSDIKRTWPSYKLLSEDYYKETNMETVVVPQSGNDELLSTSKKVDHTSIMWALIFKWLHRHKRDFRLHIWELCLPIMCVYVFQNIMGPEPGRVKFSLIHNIPDFNLTNHSEMQEYCKKISNTPPNKCFSNIAICNFINTFETGQFIWIPTYSYQEGLDHIIEGRAMGLIEFPHDYENHLKNRMMHRNFADNETVLGSTLSMRMDESNMILAFWAKKTIVEKYLVYMSRAIEACPIATDFLRPPIKMGTIYGSAEVFDYIVFMQTGLVILLMFVMSMAVSVLCVEDRLLGLEERDRVAGVTVSHRLVVSLVTQSFMIFIQIGIFLGLLCGLYDMQIRGSWVLAVSLIFMTSVCGQFVGKSENRN